MGSRRRQSALARADRTAVQRRGRRAGIVATAAVSLLLGASVLPLPSTGSAETGARQPSPIRPQLKTPPRGTRVNVEADKLTYDANRKFATATGRVIITYGNYVLVARKVTYDQRRDILRADGEVRLREPGGNILEADIAQLQNRFRDGFAEHLRLLLTNDATLTADYARRTDGTITVYDRVAYTRCKDCVLSTGEPLWQLKSVEATHNEDEGVIYHKNATLEFAGVPVFWLPRLSHPDPTNKRHSGFLIPQFFYSSQLGAGLEIPYFWELAPHYDITFRPVLTSKQGPLMRAIWRHRLRTGSYNVDAAGIYQLQPETVSPPGDVHERGYVRTEGDFRINQAWTWGWDATALSDETVGRRYKIDNRTEIASYAHVTGIHDRNYFTARAYHFQGLLTTDDSSTFPVMAPYIRHSYVFGQPVFGGELGFNSSIYSIHRDTATSPFTTVNHGTDQTRFITEATWQRQMINSYGQIITPFASLRSDLYITDNVPDPTAPGGFRDNEITSRFHPTAGVDIRWPFVRSDGLGQHVLTPVVQVLASTSERKSDRIGNEDAISLNFDHTSLFLHDRFTGLDRIEGGTRVNAGLLYNILFDNGGFAKFSLGESFHLAGRNSFMDGSGLEGSQSDIVAALALQPVDTLRFTYQVRVDETDLDINAQEAGLSFDYKRLTAAMNYVKLDAEPAYGRVDREEQLWFQGSLGLGGGFSLFGGFRYDFILDKSIRNHVGVRFECDCANFELFYKEDVSSDGDVDEDRAIMLSIELKTLGSTGFGSGI